MSFGFPGGSGAVSGPIDARFTCDPEAPIPDLPLGIGPNIGSMDARNPGAGPLARRTFEERLASEIGGFGDVDASITAGRALFGHPHSGGTSLLMRSMRPSWNTTCS